MAQSSQILRAQTLQWVSKYFIILKECHPNRQRYPPNPISHKHIQRWRPSGKIEKCPYRVRKTGFTKRICSRDEHPCLSASVPLLGRILIFKGSVATDEAEEPSKSLPIWSHIHLSTSSSLGEIATKMGFRFIYPLLWG